MRSSPTISVIINTLDRATMLQRCLEGLRRVRYDGDFEVIVVNGPSTDHTVDVLSEAGESIRVGHVDVPNLSISRNKGLSLAGGDIVAFLDDDAVPESSWLTELSRAYEDPSVGAAGGFVYNHTGYEYQYRFATVNRLGEPDLSPLRPQPELCFPGTYTIPHMLGANSSFRRSAITEIDGFDEEFNYYLDETDVQMRIVDAGYVIAQVPQAVVHHSYAPSSLRGSNKVAKNRFSILKNKLYFSLVHARDFMGTDAILGAHHDFVNAQRAEMVWARNEGLVSEADVEQFERDVESSTQIGLRRGLEGRRALTVTIGTGPTMPLVPYPTVSRESLCIALVSQEFPPLSRGGVGTFVHDLGLELGEMGHEVHVITKSDNHSRVDFDRGVWIHRLGHESIPSEVDTEGGVPANLWSWSQAAAAEVERIDCARRVDVVEAPIWDVQGIALLRNGRWPLVTSLQTTLKTWLTTKPHLSNDEDWLESFAFPVFEAEKTLMLNANSVRAISSAVKSDIEDAYTISLASEKIVVTHLGTLEQTANSSSETDSGRSVDSKDGCSLLFVGRIEPRKGVDTLLRAFDIARNEAPHLTLTLVGDFPLDWPDGPEGLRTAEDFNNRVQVTNSPVRFMGPLPTPQLEKAYRTADIFVAPSTYESFGLVFLEAMAKGLPVIGTDIGGIPEVVVDNQTGILVPVGNVNALADAILRLTRDHQTRKAFGAAGRLRYEDQFTAKKMAERSLALYQRAIANHSALS